MSNTGGPFSDPYGGSSGPNNPYGDSGATNPYGEPSTHPYGEPGPANPYGEAGPTTPFGSPGPYGGAAPSPYGGTDQGPYTGPAQVAPSSGGQYADPYGGGQQSYQPPGAYGPPGGYGTGGYGGYPPLMGYQNGAGGWSLGLGIAAIVLCFVPVLSQGISIAAIITGVMGRKAVSEGRANNGGMALAGIIIGASSLLITVLAILLVPGSLSQF
ncbi:DUF4190 domain-containing protein [Ruania zhangjianzhongii]|uniref:DUF4190 domain-containing protein n=1 Tax=Ruania zhangjianzhongii TaxID=2603206 RepID=UPI0011C6F065|nr:DUF4190 domain-containing protein [Ruania zhangjianzhongii]